MRPFVLVRDAAVIVAIILLIGIAREWHEWWWILVMLGIYLFILAMGALFIRLNFFIQSRNHGARNAQQIALSFDDGPASFTSEILEVLKKEAVPAAFFSIGKHAEAAPDMVKRWHDEGHIIGNHSYEHGFGFDWKNRNKMAEEISRTNAYLKQIIGRAPRLFRPPFGVTNPELSHAVNLTQMQTVGWSLRSFDTSSRNADALLKKLLKKVRGGDIILLHDNVAYTASILTAFIQGCREKGYTFVRLDKLLGVDAYA
ncbi:MAG: polysaccharide deacetylase family protein [Bacteroidetes bacterium]|nr:polysaccharide deacetylase family protein [Bacteroidota bacterium]MBS1630670.1 polysaccharide deacetylase family protein [Bacteroidota bacterium]